MIASDAQKMLEYLKRHHIGRNRPITGDNLYFMLFSPIGLIEPKKGMNGYIRALTNHLRMQGIIIGSHYTKPPGYFWPASREEKADVLAMLKQKGISILQPYYKCLETFEREYGSIGQMEIFR